MRFLPFVLALLASCGGPEGVFPRATPARPRWAAPATVELVENEEGVLGGPLDETDFEFEAETPRGPDPLHFELPDGVERGPVAALEPYLSVPRVRLSGRDPRGRGLLVLARREGSMQLHRVPAPLATLEPVTTLRDPIIQVSPVPGQRDLFTVRTDPGGSEDYPISLLRPPDQIVASASRRGDRTGAFRWSPDGRRLAFTANARDPAHMDLYVASADALDQPRLVREHAGLWNVLGWSRDGRRLILRTFRSTLDSQIDVVDPDGDSFTITMPGDVRAATTDARMSPDGAVYVTTDGGEEHVRLFRYTHPAQLEPVGEQPPWSVESIALAPDGRAIAYVTNEEGFSVVRLLDPESGAERTLPLPRGVVSGLRWLPERVLAFDLDPGTRPQEVCTFALDRDELVRWTSTDAPGDPMAPELASISTFDGRTLSAFVYRPRGEAPHPVLLWIHGGPEEQHRPTYNPIIQYLASELGIAVVAPNLRGSRGYGRTFLSLDDGTRRGDAIRDVGSVLDWIATQPDLDAARVAIHGASYGGFVVLASLVAYPDRFVAGSDQVGVSDLGTFLENTRPYRRDARRAEYGDESNDEVRAYLDSISPLASADRIRVPLLVAHGANDPRVPVGEALQIADAVREHGSEAWLMVAPGEGHSFQHRANRDAFYRLLSRFLERYLVGRR